MEGELLRARLQEANVSAANASALELLSQVSDSDTIENCKEAQALLAEFDAALFALSPQFGRGPVTFQPTLSSWVFIRLLVCDALPLPLQRMLTNVTESKVSTWVRAGETR